MEDDEPRPRWQRWLLNRFVLTPLAILLVAGGWDLYAATHDDGLVRGQVVDGAGRPVAGAQVTLWVFNFTTFVPRAAVATDGEGQFTFTGNPSHHVQVSAEKAGAGRSARVPVRLYFRSQNTTLRTPLVLVVAR